MEKTSKIYVAGHRGMVGSSIIRNLESKGYKNIITATHKELDLTNQLSTQTFLANQRPDYVFLAAAKVGGIYANSTHPADFIYENLMVQSNVIRWSYEFGVKKLLFLGSSCIYPRECPQPIKEEYLLSDYLEKTNEPYAIAKIAGIKLCQAYNNQYGCNFISVMPTNLYGPNDNYNLMNSHVFPALLRKIHEAKINNSPEVEIWGTGKAMREFLHVDDVADACVFLMNTYDNSEIINIGTGEDISISDLVDLMIKIIDYKGKIKYDTSKPDGTPKKQLDVTKLNNLGWKHKISLEEGIKLTYQDFSKGFRI